MLTISMRSHRQVLMRRYSIVEGYGKKRMRACRNTVTPPFEQKSCVVIYLSPHLGDRPPNQQASLDNRHQHVDDDDKGSKHEHAGEHAGHVEYAFRLLDQIAKSSCRAEIFADHSANHGK